ncbi:MAG: hypothetical protein ACFFCM_12255, partial [Promethearchaeota archaeon]
MDKYVKPSKKSSEIGKKTTKLISKTNESTISKGDYLLLGVSYDGQDGKAVANLYDKKTIKKHYDQSG